MLNETISEMSEETQEAYQKLDEFLELSKQRVSSHPFLVVVLMHEYFRSLYPDDPFIKERYADDYLENITQCLDAAIATLKAIKDIGHYDLNQEFFDRYLGNYESESEFKTQALFGKLWKERQSQNVLKSLKVLEESFERNGFDASYIKGKKVLDMGCGSGRFTLALAQLGAAQVAGVDLGEEGIAIAKESAKESGITNANFQKGSVLDLPFEDETFDFVFCKGVLHHTGDLNKGLEEYYRVLKKGAKGFLYLYGSGGIFWNSRRKMRDVMQMIPMEYTVAVLNMIGMPAKRTIFVDSWYVPIEDHVSAEPLEKKFKELGFTRWNRWTKGRSIELETMVFSDTPKAAEIWGEGELRYIVEK